jgi:rhodanese-related sulfurtransferase
MTFFLSLLLAATITGKADVRRMQPAELHQLMTSGEAVAIDVRGSVPFEHSHIAGAVWLPLGLMNQRAGELPEEKLVVAYCTCRAEEASLEAALRLSQLGFAKVAVLEGGFPAWTAAALPVESNRESEEEEVAPPPRGGRLAPPAGVSCDRNDLTSYAGLVKRYRRQKGKTTLTIDTSAGTTETVVLLHPGTSDPSRWYLIGGTAFTAKDWSRIERRKGVLKPDTSAVAWVCTGGANFIDWRPGTTFTGSE